MRVNLIGLIAGIAFGWILSWARLTDPAVIRDMLLLKEPHVFLIMGSAISVAAVGCRLLRGFGVRSLVTNESVEWISAPVEQRHIFGSVLFAIGWSVAGTCPGPAAAMIGQGNVGGVAVVLGILAGVSLQPLIARPTISNGQADGCAAGL